MMLFWFCSFFTRVVLLLYVEFLDEFVEMNSNARIWHQIHGFHPSFLEKLYPCHSILVCTISCSSICVCMCKPCQGFSTFKCRNICYFSASRLVIPDNSFISNQWKDTKIFLILSASSLVIPFFGCSSPSTTLRRFLFNLIFELPDSLSVMLRLQRKREQV